MSKKASNPNPPKGMKRPAPPPEPPRKRGEKELGPYCCWYDELYGKRGELK